MSGAQEYAGKEKMNAAEDAGTDDGGRERAAVGVDCVDCGTWAGAGDSESTAEGSGGQSMAAPPAQGSSRHCLLGRESRQLVRMICTVMSLDQYQRFPRWTQDR